MNIRLFACAAAAFISSAAAQTFYWHRNPQLTGDGVVGKSYNWTSNQDGTGFRPRSVMDDDFADTAIAPWTYIDSVADGNSQYSLAKSPGKLTLINRGNDVWEGTNKYAGIFRSDIQGNFDVTVKVESQSRTDNWTKSGIMAANDANNLSQGGYCILAATPGNGVTFQVDTGGAVGTLDKLWGTGLDTALCPVWLRLTKAGGVFTAYYRKSLAANWIQVGSSCTPQGPTANSQIGLFNSSHNPGISDTAVLDDFEGGGDLASTTLDLNFSGTGPTHNVNAMMSANLQANSINFTGFSGNFSFDAATLNLSGNAAFSSTMTVSSTTGALAMIGNTGTQLLTPPAGTNGALPAITKSGNAVLKLGGTLNATSLALTGGTLDFNGFDLTVTGNLSVTKGTSASFANLGGRHLVAGSASLLGTSAGSLNLNPASAWTINAGGSLAADYAIITNSSALGSRGSASAHCTDGGGNSAWDFAKPNGCDTMVTVTSDTAVDEGQPVSLKGKAACASTYQWSVVSGPAPRILDPEVLALSFAAPRVTADTIIIYRFTADFGAGPVSKDVRVTVREAIPDPIFTLPGKVAWNGNAPLVLRPTVTNAHALLIASYNPPLQYFWSLSPKLSDSAHAGDSLVLSKPSQGGNMNVTLCMTNGGVESCDSTAVSIALAPAALSRTRLDGKAAGLIGARLTWNADGLISIRNAQGRVLWRRAGVRGALCDLPRNVFQLLKKHQAWLSVDP